MTYADLKAWIASHLQRSDLTSVIPNFIALAESDMQMQLSKQPSLYEWATATTAIDNPLVDVVGMYRLHGASIAGLPLRIVTPGMIRPNSGNSGQPDMLCFEGNSTLRFYPTPDAAYTIDVLHTPLLSIATEPNWILSTVPAIYQYGTLAHAVGYLHDDSRVPEYAQIYQDAMDKLINSRRHGDIADSPDPLYIGMLDNDTWMDRRG